MFLAESDTPIRRLLRRFVSEAGFTVAGEVASVEEVTPAINSLKEHKCLVVAIIGCAREHDIDYGEVIAKECKSCLEKVAIVAFCDFDVSYGEKKISRGTNCKLELARVLEELADKYG